MTWDQIQGKWPQLKSSAKQEFGSLSENDLEMIGGSREKLIGKLQERYSYNREEAQRRADQWIQKAQLPAYAQSPQAHSGQQESRQHAGKH